LGKKPVVYVEKGQELRLQCNSTFSEDPPPGFANVPPEVEWFKVRDYITIMFQLVLKLFLLYSLHELYGVPPPPLAINSITCSLIFYSNNICIYYITPHYDWPNLL